MIGSKAQGNSVVGKDLLLLLLLLLSHFSRVQLCATPQTAAYQAPPSLGFSRQEQWSGLPFPSPMHESEKWKWGCSVVSDCSQPHGLSLPGSSTHGIFQARVLEWGAIAFSEGELERRLNRSDIWYTDFGREGIINNNPFYTLLFKNYNMTSLI